MRKSILPVGMIVAYVFVLNAGTFFSLAQDKATIIHAGITKSSADEAHYFGLMHKMSQGYFGSASLREHANTLDNVMFGAMPQAMLLRIIPSVPAVAWLGDILFPILAGLLLFVIGRKWMDPLLAGYVAVAALHVPDVGWLRSVSPQVTLTLFLTFLALFAWRKKGIYRGNIIALLIFVQIHFAVLATCIEALEWLRRIVKEKKVKQSCISLIPLAFPVLIALALKMWMGQTITDPDAATDTLRRLGLIPSHLPAAPTLQALLIFAMLAAWFVWRKKKDPILLTLTIAGLFVLNQSVLHGKDAIFGLYYTYPLKIIVIITIFSGIALWRGKIAMMVGAACTLIAFVALGTSVFDLSKIQKVESEAYLQSNVPEVIATLQAYSGSEIVIAPYEIADTIPALTNHFVFFNHFARFGHASDKEIAERYLLYHDILQIPRAEEDKTYSLVFGQYAGNIAARKRTLCALRNFFEEKTECAFPIADHIFRQDVRTFLETGHLDPNIAFDTFSASVVVTEHPLPESIAKRCVEEKQIGTYMVYRCQ